MNNRAIILQAKNKGISVKLIPGHFSTSHSHINYLIDMTALKSQYKMAKMVAKELAEKLRNTPVDTIISLERTKMIAAFLAEELTASGLNLGQDMNVISPEVKSGNQILIRDNMQDMLWDKNVLVVTTSITTGITAASAAEAVRYYGGRPVGIAAIFSQIQAMNGVTIHSIFTGEDISGYETYSISDCPLCKQGVKLDALVNSYGYSKL